MINTTYDCSVYLYSIYHSLWVHFKKHLLNNQNQGENYELSQYW